MLTLRLQRAGKKNKPEFRIVLAQSTSAANKKFLEILGNYNPRTKEFKVKDESRLKYWVEQHVSISPTLNNLLISKNLLEGSKKKSFLVPTKVKAKKADEEAKAKAEAEAKAEADAAAAAAPAPEEPVAETETPVESEAPAETVAESTPEPEAAPEVVAEEPKTEETSEEAPVENA